MGVVHMQFREDWSEGKFSHVLSASRTSFKYFLNKLLSGFKYHFKGTSFVEGFFYQCSIFEEGMSLARKWIANKRKKGIMI